MPPEGPLLSGAPRIFSRLGGGSCCGPTAGAVEHGSLLDDVGGERSRRLMSLSARFVAPQFRNVEDAAARRQRIAALVCDDIVPRLAQLHAAAHPTAQDIAHLAWLVIASDGQEATDYVRQLRNGGITVDCLFEELLEPAARRLGELWDEDEVDFVDVTLGVGRLQALLSVFNSTHEIAPAGNLRSVLMLTVPGEQHSFGIAMVERFLDAGGWTVTTGHEASPGRLGEMVRRQWFAVAGLTLTARHEIPAAQQAIRAIRSQSLNPAIGIMAGGPLFCREPDLAAAIGADGTATSAVGAVLLAQKLLDQALADEAARNQTGT